MKKILFFQILLVLLLSSCATVRNLNDYDQKTYELIENNQEEVLGTVSVTRFGFIWETFEPEDSKTLKMLAKLEKKAKNKYGENIKLTDIRIGDLNSAGSIPLWVGGGLSGIGLMSLSPNFRKSYADPNTSNTEGDAFTTAGSLTIIGTALFKFNKATAKVVRTTGIYNRDSISLITESDLERKKELKDFTEREIEAINNRKIYIGMSEAALRKSWGNPRDINTSVGSWGVHRQYCYANFTYVYVENGYVTSWQK